MPDIEIRSFTVTYYAAAIQNWRNLDCPHWGGYKNPHQTIWNRSRYPLHSGQLQSRTHKNSVLTNNVNCRIIFFPEAHLLLASLPQRDERSCRRWTTRPCLRSLFAAYKQTYKPVTIYLHEVYVASVKWKGLKTTTLKTGRPEETRFSIRAAHVTREVRAVSQTGEIRTLRVWRGCWEKQRPRKTRPIRVNQSTQLLVQYLKLASPSPRVTPHTRLIFGCFDHGKLTFLARFQTSMWHGALYKMHGSFWESQPDERAIVCFLGLERLLSGAFIVGAHHCHTSVFCRWLQIAWTID